MSDMLVTGGTGFIGSSLVRSLVAQGDKVKVFDNNFRGRTENLTDILADIELIEGDIRSQVDVRRAVKGVDQVFHLAYVNGTEYFYKQPQLVLEIGVKGTLNVVDAAIEEGVSDFIYASSSEVYQTPEIIPTPEDVPLIIPQVKNPRYSYGGGKILGELLTLHYIPSQKIRRIIFRPHNIYGPSMGWEHVIPQLIKRIVEISGSLSKKHIQLPIQGSGNETRAFCYIDDAVQGILLCAKKGIDGNIYHVGKQEEISIRELVSEIASILNIKIDITTSNALEGSTPRRCPDISKLQSLGYNPVVSLKVGLERTVEWYKERILHGT